MIGRLVLSHPGCARYAAGALVATLLVATLYAVGVKGRTPVLRT